MKKLIMILAVLALALFAIPAHACNQSFSYGYAAAPVYSYAAPAYAAAPCGGAAFLPSYSLGAAYGVGGYGAGYGLAGYGVGAAYGVGYRGFDVFRGHGNVGHFDRVAAVRVNSAGGVRVGVRVRR